MLCVLRCAARAVQDYPHERGGLPACEPNVTLAPGLHLSMAWPPFAYTNNLWEK